MADPAHEATDKLIEEIRRRVSREYLHAYKEAKAKLSDYLSRFEAKDRIHAEAVRRGEETEADYREWRRGQMLVGKRWQELVDTLAEDYRNTDRIAASIINGYLPDAYALNHDYGTFQVEQGSRVDTSYTLYDRATVERLLRDQQDLLPKAKVDGKKDKAWNRKHISSAITQGVLQGESLDKVARRLRSVAEMDHRAAMRTARTAMTSAQNAGRTDAYRRAEGMGIKVRKQWLATLDQRTRHSHRRLDGEVVGLDEEFSNGLRYPGDPEGAGSEVYNCRCTLVADLPGVDYSEGTRHSKLGDMTYEEWREEHESRKMAAVTLDMFPKQFIEASEESIKAYMDVINSTPGIGSSYDRVYSHMLEAVKTAEDHGYEFDITFDPDTDGGSVLVDENSKRVHVKFQKVDGAGQTGARSAAMVFTHEMTHFEDAMSALRKYGSTNAFVSMRKIGAQAVKKIDLKEVPSYVLDTARGFGSLVKSRGDTIKAYEETRDEKIAAAMLGDMYDALTEGRLVNEAGVVGSIFGHGSMYYTMREGTKQTELLANWVAVNMFDADAANVFRRDQPELAHALDEILDEIWGD